MAVAHAKAGEPISVRALGAALAGEKTKTLVKTDRLEVIRLIVPAGKEVPTHQVAGEITVQCLEGRVVFTAADQARDLNAGEFLFLAGNTPHAVRGIEDASLLVTILLR